MGITTLTRRCVVQFSFPRYRLVRPTFLSANSDHNAFALYLDDWLVHGWINQLGFFFLRLHRITCTAALSTLSLLQKLTCVSPSNKKYRFPAISPIRVLYRRTPNLKSCVRLAWLRTGVTKFFFMTVSHEEIVSHPRPQSPRSFWPAVWIPAAGQKDRGLWGRCCRASPPHLF